MVCRWEKTHDCQFCVLDCPERHTSINIEALEQMASVPTPRQRDEIDEWLEKECHIYAGACSSVENLKYSTAREVAEKLWKKEEPVNEDLAKAAQIYAASLVLNGAVSDLTVKQLREVADKCFKAGAEWMANQGVTVEGYLIQDIEEGNGDFLCSLEYIPYNSEFNKDGEKIIAQIRKKE